MTVDRYLRMIAGAFVLLSLALGYWVSPYWYLFTAIRGAQPVSIRVHELVSDDDDPSQVGRSQQLTVRIERNRWVDFEGPKENHHEKVNIATCFRGGAVTTGGSRIAFRPEGGACVEARPLPSSRRHARPA